MDWISLVIFVTCTQNDSQNSFSECLFEVFSSTLRTKMKNGEYDNVEQMEADLSLMFENAKRYNMPNSSIYKRAFRLQQIMQVMVDQIVVINISVNSNR